MLPLQGTRLQSLIRKLDPTSYTACGKKKKKTSSILNSFSATQKFLQEINKRQMSNKTNQNTKIYYSDNVKGLTDT